MIIEEKIRANRPQVVDDTIDGETIIVNMKNGNYYSFDKVGVLIWECIVNEADLMVQVLNVFYGGRDYEALFDS